MVQFTGNIIARLRRDESAQGMAEYALLIGLIAVAAVAAVTFLGNSISNTLNEVANDLANALS
jgi:pilus assembly protein Flp/PilA